MGTKALYATVQQALGGVRGIIFDCDGVLIDSYDANTWYYNHFRQRIGLGPMDKEQEQFVHMANVYESLRHVLPEEHHEESFEYRKSFDYRLVLPHFEREKGVLRVLRIFEEMDLPLAINTNRADTLDLVLEHVGMVGVFSPRVTTLDVKNPKPDPEGVNIILKEWNMKPEEVAYIGDSKTDELTAKAAGVHFWAYADAKLDADFHISSFTALLDELTV
ncbi:MAG: HAD family hydrolase [Desulfovibrio sp.]